MSNRGIYNGFNPDGTVCGRLPTRELALKVEHCREYVAEEYGEAVPPESITKLAELAIIKTIDVAEPDNPDTIWGFVTEASFKHNGLPREID